MGFIVKFENGNQPFWLADWTGDPGRTLVRENARDFDKHTQAERAMNKTIRNYPDRKLKGRGSIEAKI